MNAWIALLGAGTVSISIIAGALTPGHERKTALPPIQVIYSANGGSTGSFHAAATSGQTISSLQGIQQTLGSLSSPGQVQEQAPAWMHFNPLGGEGALYTKLHSEVRDPMWAQSAESAISSQVTQIPAFNSSAAIEVLCGSTICEVSGSAADGQSPAEQIRAWELLQAPELESELKTRGLDRQSVEFGSDAGKPKFTILFTRAKNT